MIPLNIATVDQWNDDFYHFPTNRNSSAFSTCESTNLTQYWCHLRLWFKRTTCHMQNKTPTTQVDRFAIRISHLKHEISHYFLKYHPPLIQLLATVWLTKIRLSSHPFNFWICVRSMLLRQILMLLVFVSSYWLVTWPNILELFLGENRDGSPKEFVGPVQNGPNPNTFCFFDHWVRLVGDKPSIVYWSNTDSLCLIHVFSARIKHWSISDI
jgi:hypothetical protein